MISNHGEFQDFHFVQFQVVLEMVQLFFKVKHIQNLLAIDYLK